MKRLPKDGMIDPTVETYHTTGRFLTDSLTDEEFEICRNEHVRLLKRRLALLRRREEIRRYEISVTPLDLEHKFAELLRLGRPKARYPQNASHINRHFNEQERRVIYALVEGVIEQARWRGISWSPIFERIRKHRNSSDTP
jgi:hypothetical protein